MRAAAAGGDPPADRRVRRAPGADPGGADPAERRRDAGRAAAGRAAGRRRRQRSPGGLPPARHAARSARAKGLIEHSAIVEAFRGAAPRGGPERLDDLDRTIVALEKTMKRLESVVMGIRLLPISTVFGRFPRLVREIAHAKGKRVRLLLAAVRPRSTRRSSTGLASRSFICSATPWSTASRRAEERASAGKPPEAMLELSAASHSGRVVIRLTDDGRGLDEAKILAKAEAMGLEVRGRRTRRRSAR